MDPLTLFTIQQQSALTEHRQMAGDLGLGLDERRTEIAHAQLSTRLEQQYDPQPSFIGEVLNSCRGNKDMISPQA